MDIFTSGIIARALRSANAPVSFAKAKGDGVCVASISVLDASTFFLRFSEELDISLSVHRFWQKKILLDKIKVAGTKNKKLLSKLFCSMSSLNPKMSLWNAHENARHAEICAEMACSMAGWDLRFGRCKAVPSCPPKVAASPSCLHEALIWGLEALHSLTFSGWTPHMVSHKACHGALHIWKLGYSSPRPARLSPSIGVEGRNPVHVGRNIHHPYQAMRHHHVSRSQNFQILRTGIQIHSRKGH